MLHHHESWDGGGYPETWSGADSVPARIVAVADAFDAMRSDRPYRKACRTKKWIRFCGPGRGSNGIPR